MDYAWKASNYSFFSDGKRIEDRTLVRSIVLLGWRSEDENLLGENISIADNHYDQIISNLGIFNNL